MTYTVASFLREKVSNMSLWLTSAGYNGDVKLPALTDLALVTLAQTLHSTYATAIKERDFDKLLANKESLPAELTHLVEYVQQAAPLHDKFWRYLALFSDTVSAVHNE